MESKENSALLPYLQVAWRTEKARVDSLKEAFDNVEDDTLRSVIADYRDTTLRQAEALEDLIHERGGNLSPTRILFGQILGKLNDTVAAIPADTDPNMMIAARAIGDAHYEAALYEVIASVAEAEGEIDLAHIARALREHEVMALDLFMPYLVLEPIEEEDSDAGPFGFAEADALFV